MALSAGQGGALVLSLVVLFFSRDLYSLMQGSPEVRALLESLPYFAPPSRWVEPLP